MTIEPTAPARDMNCIHSLSRLLKQTLDEAFARRVGVAATSLAFCLLTGCTLRSPEPPSVLVILVENLGFSSFSCADSIDQDNEIGFRSFCEESVRFTHAYTPSTMSQATLASVLTGRYPFEHGVRHNGASAALSAKFETVAETAVKVHYRTSFFSGGPPIWRKSGLAQGFEIFDDNVLPALNHLYRPAHEIIPLFLKWQANEAPKGSFFSFLFLSDLQFTDDPITNEIGELRESSLESQLDEIRESLGRLVRELKRRHQWDNTYVILAGVNGTPQEPKFDEPRPLDLSSEATRVSLIIKPARKGRDGPFNWKVDANVNLTDLGTTLFEILGHPQPAVKMSAVENANAVSLTSVLHGPEPDWPEDRKVISETGWAPWRGWGDGRFAVRKGSDLFLQAHHDLLFDTLVDTPETQPIAMSDARYAASREELSDFLYSLNPSAWEPPPLALTEKMELARELWRGRSPGSDTLVRLRALVKKYPGDAQLLGWRAIWALRMADWKELKTIAAKTPEQTTWAFVADRNLGEKSVLPNDPCLSFLKSAKTTDWKFDKACRADSLAGLIEWANDATEPVARARAMESFIRSYASRVLADRISEHNWVTGLMWDTNLNRLQNPETVDLVLALPEMHKYRSLVLRRIANGNELGSSSAR